MKNKKLKRLIIFVAIITSMIVVIVCFFMIKKNEEKYTNINVNNNQTQEENKNQEQLKKEFLNLFDNEIHIKEYDTSNIVKIDKTKELVYNCYSLNEKKDNYEVDLNFPLVNINTDIAKKYNDLTQEVFANKANKVLLGANEKTIFTVSFTGFVNKNFLSLIIKSTLKEGSNAQRTMVQTYNYNLKTNENVSIYDFINEVGTSKENVSNIINAEIQEEINNAKILKDSGYEIYSRNIDDDVYKLENISEFYLNDEGKLNIIFAYGNHNFTSEMDIIVI